MGRTGSDSGGLRGLTPVCMCRLVRVVGPLLCGLRCRATQFSKDALCVSAPCGRVGVSTVWIQGHIRPHYVSLVLACGAPLHMPARASAITAPCTCGIECGIAVCVSVVCLVGKSSKCHPCRRRPRCRGPLARVGRRPRILTHVPQGQTAVSTPVQTCPPSTSPHTHCTAVPVP